MNRPEGEKMKISEKRINQAIEDLKFANGRKTERIITVIELKELIADAEATYKKNCKDKYFLGVKALEMGTWASKPNAYDYYADNVTVKIELRKGKKPYISIFRDAWGYVRNSEKRLEVVYQ